MVSSALANPCMTLKAETFAVIEPRATAAREEVERWPIEMTGAMIRLYSNKLVLQKNVSIRLDVNESSGLARRRE